MPEIHPADPATRQRIIVWGALAFCAMLLCRPLLQQFFAWVFADPERIKNHYFHLVGGVAIAFSPLMFFGHYVWRIGRTSATVKRYPPPEMKLAVDKVIVKGQKAVLMGRLLQFYGLILWGTAIGVPIMFWQITKTILSSA